MINPLPSRALRQSEVGLGLLCGVAAFMIWGLFPLYLKQLSAASALEILAHRIVWSTPFGAIIIFARRQWPEVGAAFRSRRVLVMLTMSAFAIAANWGLYVWAVVNDRVLEASIGYYINPLMYVAAGVFVLGERLRRAQIAAIALAGAGVLILTIGASQFPWTAITLAVLFTAYGYIRKTAPVGAMPGLFIETLILSPVALAYIFWLMQTGAAAFAGADHRLTVLLVIAGPVTVIPLLFFALAARRLRLSTIAFLQYIAPTGQLILGLLYGERFTLAHAICFGFIWAGLALFSFDAARASRAPAATLIPAASASPKSS
ncbi:MAG TPA: EamA family transporter RarD [Parvularculaceae bacterium]|nr:EamA family transporter RarD [Parvularculaceae bacterium]